MIRRITVLLLFSVALLACQHPGVTIYAPPELANASIFVDGNLAGHFQATQREYRWVGWRKMKEELMNAPRSETIAKLPAVAPGRHELRIVKEGYEPIVTGFVYSSGRDEVEIDHALVKSVNGHAQSGLPRPPEMVGTVTTRAARGRRN